MKRRSGLLIIGGVVVLAVALWWIRGSKSSAPSADSERSSRPGSGPRGAGRAAAGSGAALDASGRISGTVRARDGAGVARATVCARFWSDDLGREQTREPRCVTTDSAGAYTLDKLLPATYEVHAAAAKHIPATYEDPDRRRELRLSPGQKRQGIDITLEPGGVELEGVVNDIGGGGVANALIQVRSGRWFSGESAFARSDDAGEFSVWVAPGEVHVVASAEGYAPGDRDGTAPGQHVEVLLTPEAVLSGVVLERGSDAPVAGALVSVGSEWRFDSEGSGEGSTLTDERGRFRITRLSPGRYKPSARAEGRYGEAAESVLLGVGQSKDDVVVKVHPALVVAGKVVVAGDRTPCERGSVRLDDKKRARDAGDSIREGGEIRMKAVLPGTYQVTVRCRGFVARDEYPAIEISDKDVTDRVWEVEDGGKLAGSVVDESGRPVADAAVQARGVDGDPRGRRSRGWDRSDDGGRFEIAGLAAGSYRVTVDAADHPAPQGDTTVEVAAGATEELKLVLPAGGTVRGSVVDETDRPLGGIRVRVMGKRWGWGQTAITRDDGGFEITGLEPGEVRVVAGRGWGKTLRSAGKGDDDVQGQRVAIAAGEVAEVKLVVESQSGTITGRIVDESGKKVGDAFVSVQRESEAAGANVARQRRFMRWTWGDKPVLTDTEGRFTVRELSEGKYTVRAFRRGGGEAFAEGVEVGTDVTLTIHRTGSIAGTVRRDDGKSPEEFTIAVGDEKSGFSRSERFFRTDGVWIMRDLPAGEFLVSASAAEGLAKTMIDLGEGEERTGVGFELESRVTVTGRMVSLSDDKPVAGMMVMVQPVRGGDSASGFSFGSSAGDRKHITDDSGAFEIECAAAGRVYIQGVPMGFQDSPYSFIRTLRTIPGGGSFDVGTIRVPRRRVKMRERGGDLGFRKSPHPG